jgi:hypothetical protein
MPHDRYRTTDFTSSILLVDVWKATVALRARPSRSRTGAASLMANELVQHLDDFGFAGALPGPLGGAVPAVPRELSDPRRVAPLDWPKGCAVTSRAYFESREPSRGHVGSSSTVSATHVMLFGACILTQKPGADHPWHSDMETSGPVGKTLSVWIGLENVDGPMQFVASSHAFGATVQEVRQRRGVKAEGRDGGHCARVGQAARPARRADDAAVRVGEALAFVGQAWHHSRNRGNGRSAGRCFLQYATPETPNPHARCRVRRVAVQVPPDRRSRPASCSAAANTRGVNRIVPARRPATR